MCNVNICTVKIFNVDICDIQKNMQCQFNVSLSRYCIPRVQTSGCIVSPDHGVCNSGCLEIALVLHDKIYAA